MQEKREFLQVSPETSKEFFELLKKARDYPAYFSKEDDRRFKELVAAAIPMKNEYGPSYS